MSLSHGPVKISFRRPLANLRFYFERVPIETDPISLTLSGISGSVSDGQSDLFINKQGILFNLGNNQYRVYVKGVE